MNPPSK